MHRKNLMKNIVFTASCALLSGVFAVLAVPAFAQNTPLPSGGLAPGLYVSVTNGQIALSNKGGSTNFTAGQFGFTSSLTQPPVIVPKNPAMQFTPPPAFSSSTSTQASNSGAKAGTVDCVVR